MTYGISLSGDESDGDFFMERPQNLLDLHPHPLIADRGASRRISKSCINGRGKSGGGCYTTWRGVLARERLGVAAYERTCFATCQHTHSQDCSA
jgi:hypothetical protein